MTRLNEKSENLFEDEDLKICSQPTSRSKLVDEMSIDNKIVRECSDGRPKPVADLRCVSACKTRPRLVEKTNRALLDSENVTNNCHKLLQKNLIMLFACKNQILSLKKSVYSLCL